MARIPPKNLATLCPPLSFAGVSFAAASFAAVLFAACLGGCSGPDPKDDASDPEPVDQKPEPVVVDTLPNGLFAMNFGVSAVGGLAVPFQLDVVTTQLEDEPPIFERFDLRAVGVGDALSEVLASAAGTPVTDAGFTADLGEFVLPSAYSVTGSDVSIAAVLAGERAAADDLCGTLSGQLVTFNIDLAGSTFGAVPWEAREAGIPTSCDADIVEEIPRIVDCPTLTAGVNSNFVSGGEPREFEIVLPTSYEPGQTWPLVFAFHGFGGTMASMLDDAQLRSYADTFGEGVLSTAGAILVVPQGEDVGGTDGWDAFSNPLTNLDLVLFDDMLTCARESFSVDPQRVHVTGMSNGGLFTGYLLAARPEEIASAAPMSGGMGIDPLLPQTGGPATPPVLALWGGDEDFAFEQDFNLLTNDMIETLVAQGNFVVGCDHGLGHTLDPSFWPWVLEFLVDHPRDIVPEPYVGGLPGDFPPYCAIR